MAGIVEVDKLLKARAARSAALTVVSVALIASTMDAVQLLGLATVGTIFAAISAWRGKHEADEYVVRRCPASQLPPPLSAVRVVLPETFFLIVLTAVVATAAFGVGGGVSTGLDVTMGILPADAAFAFMERRGWRRQMAQHPEQVWVATQPFWRIRSRSRVHYEGVFVLDERPVAAASVASGQ